VLFLGDGLSTHDPLKDGDRLAIAKQMVDRKIAFFPGPAGNTTRSKTLHGLAYSTGGVVLRTRVEEELLVDAIKRYEQAFAGPVMYDATLQLRPISPRSAPRSCRPSRRQPQPSSSAE